ncbi:MAG: response regulator [Chitinophagaceae bacterium]|nr:MAG: response regulator [Chitinophagaceae bacterium]
MKKEVTILLVEDNEGDVVLTVEALKQAEIHNEVVVVRDGEEALNYLFRQGKYSDSSLPDLIFLDINLPRIDGKEVLARIKNDDLLKSIPVVMLTTSDSEKDIRESYAQHANCYITKPVDFNKFMDVVHMINDFWINLVRLPQPSSN